MFKTLLVLHSSMTNLAHCVFNGFFVVTPQDPVVSISEFKKYLNYIFGDCTYCCKNSFYIEILFYKLCDSYILYWISLSTVTRCILGPKNWALNVVESNYFVIPIWYKYFVTLLWIFKDKFDVIFNRIYLEIILVYYDEISETGCEFTNNYSALDIIMNSVICIAYWLINKMHKIA